MINYQTHQPLLHHLLNLLKSSSKFLHRLTKKTNAAIDMMAENTKKATTRVITIPLYCSSSPAIVFASSSILVFLFVLSVVPVGGTHHFCEVVAEDLSELITVGFERVLCRPLHNDALGFFGKLTHKQMTRNASSIVA